MNLEAFFDRFDQFLDAPGAVSSVRALVKTLAVQGALSAGSSGISEWRSVTLDQVCDLITDGEHATPQRVVTGIPLATAKNIRDGFLDLTHTDFVTKETAEKCWKRCKPRDGDLLMVCVGATTGRVCLAKLPPDMVLVRSVALLRPDTNVIEATFLDLFLRSSSGQTQIWKGVRQNAQPCLYLGKMSAFTLTLPNLAEQKRIVAKVDELMALCDRLETQQQEREIRHAELARASLTRFSYAPTPANLQFLFHPSYNIAPNELRKSILTLAVQGKLVPQDPNEEPAEKLIAGLDRDRAKLAATQGVRPPKEVPSLTAEDYPHDIPDSWRWRRIGHLALLIDYGTSQKADSDSSKVPVYRMGNIVGGRLVNDNLKYVDSSIDDLPSLYLKTNDILFNRTNSYELVGKAGIFMGRDNTATFASYLIRIRFPSILLYPPFFSIAMNAPYFRQTQIEPEVVQQCGQANFNGTKLASTVVPVPPLAEQRRIVAKVNQLLSLVDELEMQLDASRAAAAHLLEAVVAGLTTRDGNRSSKLLTLSPNSH
jgi:type I restriction enzyme S subunit